MIKRQKPGLLFIILFYTNSFFLAPTFFQQSTSAIASDSNKLTLTRAVICEDIQDFAPQNEAIVFSISTGKEHCFSFFETIPEKTFIYHNWYFQDQLTSRIKLTLKPPSWRTYSTIQLREADKGPWKVDITDSKGRIIKVLRFSITD